MKKLLFVINTLGYGGAERALLNLLGKLNSEEYQVSLFVLTGQGELIHELPASVTVVNKDYSDCSVLTKEGRFHLFKRVLQAGIVKGGFFKRAGYLSGNLRRMWQEHRIQPDKLLWRILAEASAEMEESYDLAVAYLEGGATYYVADRVRAKKKAAFIHIDYVQAGYTQALDLDCYQKMDHIYAVSDEVREHFLEVYPEHENKVSVFHNLINQERIHQLANEQGGFPDDFQGIRILTVGRLTQQKRYDVAIEAMALLKEKSPVPVRWYVLGEGELRQALERKITKLGLQEDFLLLSVSQNPFSYYRDCDLYVHATGFEGKSIAIQEAQTLGKPILATDCSGNREQIEQDVDGRLCPLDPESVSDEILWMIAHPHRCKEYGQKARQKRMSDMRELESFLSLIET